MSCARCNHDEKLHNYDGPWAAVGSCTHLDGRIVCECEQFVSEPPLVMLDQSDLEALEKFIRKWGGQMKREYREGALWAANTVMDIRNGKVTMEEIRKEIAK